MYTEEKLEDEIKICIDCGGRFLFTAGEKLFYRSKKLTPTLRCPDCRKSRRQKLVPDPRYEGRLSDDRRR